MNLLPSMGITNVLSSRILEGPQRWDATRRLFGGERTQQLMEDERRQGLQRQAEMAGAETSFLGAQLGLTRQQLDSQYFNPETYRQQAETANKFAQMESQKRLAEISAFNPAEYSQELKRKKEYEKNLMGIRESALGVQRQVLGSMGGKFGGGMGFSGFNTSSMGSSLYPRTGYSSPPATNWASYRAPKFPDRGQLSPTQTRSRIASQGIFGQA